MPVVKITMSYPAWPIVRQTPGCSSQWGDYHFAINEDVDECDAWVVLDDLRRVERRVCPAERTLFMTFEPPTYGSYPDAFLAQFSGIAMCGGHSYAHRGLRVSFPPQPWYFGLNMSSKHPNMLAKRISYLSYDQISALKPQKTKLMSVVCSDRKFTEGHRRRFEFVKSLKKHFGNRLDWFGMGVKEVVDKSEALIDYKYHIAIENGFIDHYWTEKLADAYLGWSMPIYYGCPNVTDYFDRRSLIQIDILDIEGSIRRIEEAIASNAWEASIDAIAHARSLILEKYNLFPIIISLLEEFPISTGKKIIVLRPRSYFVGRTRTLLHRVRRKLQFGLGITRRVPFLARI